jgi:glycosyltransferase involved in cell wall biosynthesis
MIGDHPRSSASLGEAGGVASRQILLAWQGASHFAWGIVGVQIALAWSGRGQVLPVMAKLEAGDLWLDPLRLMLLRSAMQASAELAPRMAEASAANPLRLDYPVVHCMGNSASIAFPHVRGGRNIGRIVFENTSFAADSGARLEEMDALTVISNWNGELLREVTRVPIEVIHEGIDPAQFFPGPRSGLMARSRFYIFAGGKAEFRKGQDLILAAFRIFASRHPDAVLVTAWQNPWLKGAVGVRGVLRAPLQADRSGQALDILRWAADNGIDPANVIDLGQMPNALMPSVLREMDCAVCASRAEGGTNLPIMEAMACGVPVIFPNNTGMRDLIEPGNSIVLQGQAAIKGAEGRGTQGWGDSSIDEIVAALEALYDSSELRERLGSAAARFMRARTWQRHAAQLADLVTAG